MDLPFEFINKIALTNVIRLHNSQMPRLEKNMVIKYLESLSTGADVDLTCFNEVGDFEALVIDNEEDMKKAVCDADVIIVNKLKVNERTIGEAKKLKLVCEAATGIDNLDIDYLDKRGIQWRNVSGYSTDAVAQHTFAMYFFLEESLIYYDDYVKSGEYTKSPSFTHYEKKFHELCGMTWGIIGLGAIGRKVARIAEAFGAKVIYASASGGAPQEGFTQVDMDTLLRESDVVSIHAPLNEHTRHLLDEEAFSKMKKSAILINVGRGPIVDEVALYNALENNEIKAAGLDVLENEPMREKNPLLQIKSSEKLLITPHLAWASVEARTRLVHTMVDQIKEWSKSLED